jgi:hypothetical protein
LISGGNVKKLISLSSPWIEQHVLRRPARAANNSGDPVRHWTSSTELSMEEVTAQIRGLPNLYGNQQE